MLEGVLVGEGLLAAPALERLEMEVMSFDVLFEVVGGAEVAKALSVRTCVSFHYLTMSEGR